MPRVPAIFVNRSGILDWRRANLSSARRPYWQMVCGSWPLAAVKGGRGYRQTLCGPRPEPGMRSIQQRGPGPVPGPIPGPAPDPGPPRRQLGSTQRHWRPKPEPGTTQQAQRAGVSSTGPGAADSLSTAALTGAASALLLAPAPATEMSTATMNSNLGFISFSHSYRMGRDRPRWLQLCEVRS